MDIAGGDRPPCGGGADPPFRLPRPHHAADAAGIERFTAGLATRHR
jgi:hypothetical protein